MSKIIIGGAQSTGSSLLVNILNRHSQLAAGPETYLFMHPKLYHHWKQNRKHLIKTNKLGGLKSETWFKMNGASLLQDFYGWEGEELKRCILGTEHFAEFADLYMARALQKQNAKTWIEKSPANAVAFPDFLNTFDSPKVIHTCRNPYDAMVSLMKRGYSAYYAAGTYIVNTALALRMHHHKNYHTVSYEDLVQKPAQTIQALMHFLEVNIEAHILEPTEQEKNEKIQLKGWKNNEKGKIKKSSLNRFAEETPEAQEKIKAALFTFAINPTYAEKHKIQHKNIQAITEVLNYKIHSPTKINQKRLQQEKRQDQISRLKKVYPAFGANYPGSLVF